MPQPFDASKSYQLRGDALLQRPKLAVRISTIAALWSGTEALQGTILAKILDWEPAAGAAMYTAMTSTVAQRAAILSAAEIKMSGSRLSNLKELFEQAGKRGKERNSVVHAMWGLSDAYPEELIHCTVQNWIMREGLWQDLHRKGAKTAEELFDKSMKSSHPEDLMVYNEKDLIDIEGRISNLNGLLWQFIRGFDPQYWDMMDSLQQGFRERASAPPSAL